MPSNLSNLPFPLELRQKIYGYLFQHPSIIINEYDRPCFKAAPIETSLFRVNKSISLEAQAFFKKRGFMVITLPDPWTSYYIQQAVPSRLISTNELDIIPAALRITIISEPAHATQEVIKSTHLIIDLKYLHRVVDLFNAVQANAGPYSSEPRTSTHASLPIQGMHITLNQNFDKLGMNARIFDNCAQQLRNLRLGSDPSGTDLTPQPLVTVDLRLPLDCSPKQKTLCSEIMAEICRPAYHGQASIQYAQQLEDHAQRSWDDGNLWTACIYTDLAIACFANRYNNFNHNDNSQFREVVIDLLFKAAGRAIAMGRDGYNYAETAQSYVYETADATMSTEQTLIHYTALRRRYQNTGEEGYFGTILETLEAAYVLFKRQDNADCQFRILNEFTIRLTVWQTDPKNLGTGDDFWSEFLAPTLTRALEEEKEKSQAAELSSLEDSDSDVCLRDFVLQYEDLHGWRD